MNETTKAQIEGEIAKSDIVLFMKGNPIFPQCGFSATTAGVLSHMGVDYHAVDVLQDMEVREGIKAFSSWPTIPQVYVKGEFIGGCDIVKDMFETGELHDFFKSKGIDVPNVEA